jgi:hypothetical protein
VVNYTSGSGTTTLTFNYTVSAGDTSADLDFASTSALALNGGIIKDSVGNNATLTLPQVGGIASIAGQKAVIIDTTDPLVTFSSINPVSPGATQTPTLTVNLSEAATSLRLFSDASCSAPISAAGAGVAGPNALTTTSLTANGTTSIFARATDPAGNVGLCSSMTVYTHDGAAPAVTSVTSTTANGTYGIGQTIVITAAYSETVYVTGAPRITLATGSANGAANYVSGSGSNTLTFNYVVAAGDNAADLEYSSASSLTLNGGTIKDISGNNALLALPALLGPNTLGAQKAIVIDTTAPSITYESISPAATAPTLTPTVSMNLTEAATVTLYRENTCTVAVSAATVLAAGSGQTITTTALTNDIATTVYAKAVDSVNNAGSCTTLVTYTNDTVAPTVASFVKGTSQPLTTNSVPITYTLTFNEPVVSSSLTAADIGNTGCDLDGDSRDHDGLYHIGDGIW